MRFPACSYAVCLVEPIQGTGIMDIAIGLRAYEGLKDGDLAQRL
jgi:hypothetical protein